MSVELWLNSNKGAVKAVMALGIAVILVSIIVLAVLISTAGNSNNTIATTTTPTTTKAIENIVEDKETLGMDQVKIKNTLPYSLVYWEQHEK